MPITNDAALLTLGTPARLLLLALPSLFLRPPLLKTIPLQTPQKLLIIIRPLHHRTRSTPTIPPTHPNKPITPIRTQPQSPMNIRPIRLPQQHNRSNKQQKEK